jgi:hypothetical protein
VRLPEALRSNTRPRQRAWFTHPSNARRWPGLAVVFIALHALSAVALSRRRSRSSAPVGRGALQRRQPLLQIEKREAAWRARLQEDALEKASSDASAAASYSVFLITQGAKGSP